MKFLILIALAACGDSSVPTPDATIQSDAASDSAPSDAAVDGACAGLTPPDAGVYDACCSAYLAGCAPAWCLPPTGCITLQCGGFDAKFCSP